MSSSEASVEEAGKSKGKKVSSSLRLPEGVPEAAESEISSEKSLKWGAHGNLPAFHRAVTILMARLKTEIPAWMNREAFATPGARYEKYIEFDPDRPLDSTTKDSVRKLLKVITNLKDSTDNCTVDEIENAIESLQFAKKRRMQEVES